MIRQFIKNLLPYRPIRVSSTFWDTRYREGKWDRIRAIDESAHYSVIVGYIHALKSEGRILDVGCGEGILCERLYECYYSKYVGIDVSIVAIDRASVKKNNKNIFIVSKIEDFRTDDKFDVIIFNECLYYMEKPLEILQHYEGILARNGVFIVSMCKTIESWKIWRQIDLHYSIIDAASVSNSKRVCWKIKVLGAP